MTDAQDEIRAARMQAREFQSIGFREASDLWEKELRDAARLLRDDAKTAQEEGYQGRKLVLLEAATKVMGVASGIKAFIAKTPKTDTQTSLNLEAQQ